MITKTLTAGLLAATLAFTSLTPTTATAAMSEEDAITGVLALLLLGAAIHNNRNDDPEPRYVPRPQPNNGWRVLPVECRRAIETRRHGTVRMFTWRCLNENYSHVNRLPEHCQIRVRNRVGHNRNGFRADCLRNAGFRTTRH